MKVIGLLIVKNEEDILREMLQHAAYWLDGIIAIDNGSTDATGQILRDSLLVKRIIFDDEEFNESRMVPNLIAIAQELNPDWLVDIDADEFFPVPIRHVLNVCHPEINVVTVNIKYMIQGATYHRNNKWSRIYRNKPNLFDFDVLMKLHHGKMPIRKEDRIILDSNLDVIHNQVRSYEQGMRKYNNYLKLDPVGMYQDSYEHIRTLANALRTGDFSEIVFMEK